jgi:hypothetical protein
MPPASGRARGIAIHEPFGSVVGEVVEMLMWEGLPPIAPALCNAIYPLTQRRVRRLSMIRRGQLITA